MNEQTIVNGEPLIVTDSKGLTAQHVEIPFGVENIPAYCAFPTGGERLPVILVVQEIFGIHEHIQDVCRRLAKLGCLAIAPDLYVRQGEVLGMTELEEIYPIVAAVPDSQVMQDLDAAVNWAVENEIGNQGQLGITGFCWGGRIVWLYAAHNPDLGAGVAWYGRLKNAVTENQPRHPLDLTQELKSPVLGLYGGLDHLIPKEEVELIRTRLESAHDPSIVLLFRNSGHGFFADYRSSYVPEDADAGWKELKAWFRKHGVLS